MDVSSLSKVLGLMIAASGLQRIPARISWPMHAALKTLSEEIGRRGLGRLLAVELTFLPSPSAGLAADGADDALADLLDRRVLRRVGSLESASLAVDGDALVPYRRMLMSLDAQLVEALQRAGSRWMALASTCAKYDATAAPSSSETRASGTTCRHELTPALR